MRKLYGAGPGAGKLTLRDSPLGLGTILQRQLDQSFLGEPEAVVMPVMAIERVGISVVRQGLLAKTLHAIQDAFDQLRGNFYAVLL